MIAKPKKQNLIDKHILCFGTSPTYFIQTPGKVEWFSGYPSLHGGSYLASAIDLYLYASVSPNTFRSLRIISSTYPALTLSLDASPEGLADDHPSFALVKGLLKQLDLVGVNIPHGWDIFIHSELNMMQGLGSSSAFAATILDILLIGTQLLIPISPLEKARWIQNIDITNGLWPNSRLDSLPSLEGGTIMVQQSVDGISNYQRTTQPVLNYRMLFLNVKHASNQDRLPMKQILDQMTIIAQHYQKSILNQIDPLQYQHDVNDLSRMYGTKTTDKVKFFYQENQRIKLSFLSLEKLHDEMLFEMFQESEVSAEQLLEHHLIPQQGDQRLFAAIKWIQKHLPTVHYRVYGLGFQGPIFLMIPLSDFLKVYQLLKHQFYESSLHEIKTLKQGIRIYKS
jgi:galactokinase